MTTKHDVIAAHRANPSWSCRQIADYLECLPEYVTATARRNNLRLPKRVSREPAPVRVLLELGRAAFKAGLTVEMLNDTQIVPIVGRISRAA